MISFPQSPPWSWTSTRLPPGARTGNATSMPRPTSAAGSCRHLSPRNWGRSTTFAPSQSARTMKCRWADLLLLLPPVCCGSVHWSGCWSLCLIQYPLMFPLLSGFFLFSFAFSFLFFFFLCLLSFSLFCYPNLCSYLCSLNISTFKQVCGSTIACSLSATGVIILHFPFLCVM